MKRKNILFVAALITITAVMTTAALSGETKEMSPEEKAMMDKFMAYATPGEPHAMLAEKAGEWTFTTKMWQYPGAEVEESTGSSSAKMILDGRYLLEKAEGMAMGMPFKGIGITGYDNLNKEFTGIWIDSFSTGIAVSKGTCNEDWTICTYESVGPDPVSGKNKKFKMVDRKIDDDNSVFQMYDTTSDGTEFVSFEMTYTRKAE